MREECCLLSLRNPAPFPSTWTPRWKLVEWRGGLGHGYLNRCLGCDVQAWFGQGTMTGWQPNPRSSHMDPVYLLPLPPAGLCPYGRRNCDFIDTSLQNNQNESALSSMYCVTPEPWASVFLGVPGLVKFVFCLSGFLPVL